MSTTTSNNEFVLINNRTTNEVILNKQVTGLIDTIHKIDVQEDFSNFSVTDMPPLPALGEECLAGLIYTDGTLNWCVIQTHARTEHAPVDVPDLFRQYRLQGQPWVQPIDQYDAYNIGDWCLFTDAKYYKSNINANVWSLTAYPQGWDEVDENGKEPIVDEWVQPTGGHDAYNIGDQVTFEESTYESLINANVWSPTGYPAGWEQQ